MNFSQKDIVLVSFPFSKQDESKVRPALIISNNDFNKKSEDHIMLPLTSIIKEEPYSIIINQKNLSDGKLIKTSRIKIDKIFAIHKTIVQMKIGTLNDKIFKTIKLKVNNLF